MNKKIAMSLAMVALVVVAAPAWAQGQHQGGGRAAQLFKQADSNSDGKVTLDELKTVLPGMTQERFGTLDRNGDGVLTREDLRSGGAGAGADAAGAGGAGQMLAKLKQADTNGDQQTTFEEAKAAFPQATQERFKQFDHNGDGVLSREDLGAAGGENGAGGAGQMLAKLKQADTNGDQQITFEEAKAAFPQVTQEQFSRFDRNGDGVISREDLRSGGTGDGAGGARGAGQMLAKLKQADTNGDQRITLEEAKVAFPQATQERFSRFDRNSDGVISKEDRGAAGVENGAGTEGAGQMLASLKQADTNGDGKVSLEEAKAAFPRATEEVFKRFDHNGDGFLSPEDRRQ